MSSFGSDPTELLDVRLAADHFLIMSVEDGMTIREDLAWMIDFMSGARGDRQFNSRSDVSPVKLKGYLPRITILEPIFDSTGKVSDARYRLMGTEISALYGEATGKLVSQYHGDEVCGRVAEISNHCIEQRAPALGLSKALSNGRSFVNVSVLYFPLSADQKTVNQFLIYSAVERVSIGGF